MAQNTNQPITTIKNPLKDNDVYALLKNLMDLVAIVGGIVLTFLIIYSGYKYVISKGDPGKIKEAKDMFFACIIGGAILLGADIIANVVVNTVKCTTGAGTC